MESDKHILRQCAQMSDIDLVLAVTRDRSDYEAEFQKPASDELERRGLSVEAFVNHATLARGVEDPVDVGIEEVVSRMNDETDPWVLFIITNCLNETILVQRELAGWTIHEYEEDTYLHSFFIDDAANEIRQFLSLEIGSDVETVNLDEWVALEQTESTVYLRRLVAELTEAGIECTVQPPQMLGNPDGPYTARIPPDRLNEGREAVERIDERILGLHRKAESLAEADDRAAELEMYDLLVELEPESPAVWYNRGAVLKEMGRNEDAARDFLEAITLLAQGGDVRSLIPKRRAGGLLGSLMGSGSREAPSIPEAVEDTALQLGEILEHRPEDLDILACLAFITRQGERWGDAAEYYRRILAIVPGHEAAALGLASLPDEGDD